MLTLVIRCDKMSYFVSNGPGKIQCFSISRRYRRAVEYRHVILEKEGAGEKPVNDNSVMELRKAITFGGKFIFLGVA